MGHLMRAIAVVAIVLALGGPAAAASDHDAARDAVEAGRAMPLSTIVSNVSRRYPGRLLDADMGTGRGGAVIYRLQWLTSEGNVLRITVNGRNGQILDVKGKH
jgi:uncharacterized membrane protein YkoI